MFTKKHIVILCWFLVSLLIIAAVVIGYIVLGAKNKVCLHSSEYKELLKQTHQTRQTQQKAVVVHDQASTRDRQVLNDPLYPALNRSETRTHNNTVSLIDKKQLYNNTQEFSDRYRLVAYVSAQDKDKVDSGGNVWKLFGRQKNRNQAEFYMVPSNNNFDMKIMLNNDIIVGNDKLRDIYTIPNTLTFNSPLLNQTSYQVIELPMNDYTNMYN